MHFTSKHALKALILLGAVEVVFMKAPRFRSRPRTNYTVMEGRKVKLKCEVTGTNDPSHNRTLTAWRKEGIKSPRNSVIRKSRYWERFKVKNGKFLRIRNVKKKDAGVYWCIAKNKHGWVKAKIKLQVVPASNRSYHFAAVLHTQNPEPTVVVKAPLFRDKDVVHAIKRVQGKILRLPCHATGNPRPKIRWRKTLKNRIIPIKRKRRRKGLWTLTIRRLRTADSGVYQCIVWNKHGNATRKFFVQVIGKDLQDHPREPSSSTDRPKPIIQKHLLKNVTVLEGETATLSCTAYSNERPKFTWLKWSTFNHPNNLTVKVTMLNSSTTNVRFIRSKVSRKTGDRMIHCHKLKLLNVSKADQGQYTCVVASSGGIVSAHMHLTVNLKRQKDPDEEPQRKSTSQPPNSLDGVSIPLAALIAVPVVLAILLVIAIIWCYIQIVIHRKQLQTTKMGMYGPDGTLKYGVSSGSVTNGHVMYDSRPGKLGMEISNVTPVTHEPEVTQSTGTNKCERSSPPECILPENQILFEDVHANTEPKLTSCHGDIAMNLNTLQNANHSDCGRTAENSENLQLCSCSRTSKDQCFETHTSDVTCVNPISQDNSHRVDQNGVKNSDV